MDPEVNASCSLGSDNSFAMLPRRQKDGEEGSCSHSALTASRESAHWAHPRVDYYFIKGAAGEEGRLWLQ